MGKSFERNFLFFYAAEFLKLYNHHSNIQKVFLALHDDREKWWQSHLALIWTMKYIHIFSFWYYSTNFILCSVTSKWKTQYQIDKFFKKNVFLSVFPLEFLSQLTTVLSNSIFSSYSPKQIHTTPPWISQCHKITCVSKICIHMIINYYKNVWDEKYTLISWDINFFLW